MEGTAGKRRVTFVTPACLSAVALGQQQTDSRVTFVTLLPQGNRVSTYGPISDDANSPRKRGGVCLFAFVCRARRRVAGSSAYRVHVSRWRHRPSPMHGEQLTRGA